MAAAHLEVHLYGRHVADLLDAGDGLCALRYTPDGVRAGPAARLSLALPPREEPYPALRGAQRWADALLPEGRGRDALVEEWGVPADDTFGLLSVVGRDVAGAATILQPGEDPSLPGAGYTPLSDAELAVLVRDVHRRPLALNRERGVRLSLVGLQDKLALHRPHRSKRLHLPLHGAPSTVIVKPEPLAGDRALDLAGLATNELFGLTLAGVGGLRAAAASVLRVDERPCLVVERYDRDRHVDPPSRLHQEDLLMALGRDHRLRYEEPTAMRLRPGGGFGERRPVRTEPGPALAELADLVAAVVSPAAQLWLLAAVTFNVAFGNADAHARNYSLLLTPEGGVEPAPLYDLVCTRLVDALDAAPAQRVNGVDDLDAITRDDLVAEAEAWGLRRQAAGRVVDRTLARLHDRLEPAAAATARAGGDPAVLDRLVPLVDARLARLRGR